MAERAICISVVAKNANNSLNRTIVNKRICKFSTKLSMSDIINEVVDQDVDAIINKALDNGDYRTKLSETENGDPLTIDNDETLNTAVEFCSQLRYIKFILDINNSVDTNNNKELGKNAFECLLNSSSGVQQKAPKIDQGQTVRFTEKDRLYNAVCDHLSVNQCYFPNSMSSADVKKNVLTIVNALWYLDGNTGKFAERAQHKQVSPIPERFLQSDFVGFNDWKKKRKKAPFLTQDVLKSHSSSLFRLLSGKYTCTWGTFRDDVENLSMSMNSYAAYLEDKNEDQQKRQKENLPPRQVGENTWLDIKYPKETIGSKYYLLDNTIRKIDCYEYVHFNEELHLTEQFNSCSERYHFVERISLSVPVCVLTYSPGGSLGKVVYVWRIPEDLSVPDIVKKALAIYERLKPSLPEFHTRQMRKDFINKYCHLSASNIPKHVLRAIYSDLSMDSTAMQNPTLDIRVQQSILSEDPDLCLDMRKMNPGRPEDTFNVFFEKLSQKVEEFAAVDERRHGSVCHFSKYISVKDLIQDVAKDVPSDTPIPSESTVLYSFVPKNAHTKAAKLYTSKIPLQFKVQTRQLRLSHIDEHYCSAVFKYARQYAVKFKEDVMFLCLDDKSKVDFGEPGQAIQSGVRGKKSIIPVNSCLSALDHDQQSKGSLTPSVCLKVELPDCITGSFYRGKVCVTYKDSVFESSSPFRHAAEIEKFLSNFDIKPVMILYSDGGPDHRLTYHSVKLSLIVMFKRLGVDTLIAIRTAPGHSWLNPAERIMSIINLALQNCALTRDECQSDLEHMLKSANRMSEIRAKANKNPALQPAWLESIRPLKDLLGDRTSRLSLKDVPFLVQEAASKEEVDEIEANVQMYIDGEIEKGKYQQQQLKSKEDYQKFLTDHCKQRHYMFQIRKCNQPNCCGPRIAETEFPWLPDPILRQDDKDHYKPFEDVLNTETQESRPSAMVQKPREVAEHLQGVRNQGLVAQNVRRTVSCYECGKPRCIFSKKALSQRDSRALGRLLEKHDYCCGSMVTPEGDALAGIVAVRLQMSCEMHVEFAYYASSLGRQDICAHCGGVGAEKNRELCKKFRVVLPVCAEKESSFTEIAIFLFSHIISLQTEELFKNRSCLSAKQNF